MDNKIFTLVSNENIANGIFKAVLKGDTAAITVPGQFVNLKLDGLYLRRPISVCDCEGDELTLIYKVVGEGTEKMSAMSAGEKLDLLTGLGNGFDVSKCVGDHALLVGGGVGVPPLYMLCKRLIEAGVRVTVVCGFASASDVFYEKEFADLGATVRIATADGSYGTKGFVTDVIKDIEGYSYF